jgi:hypothetical protein
MLQMIVFSLVVPDNDSGVHVRVMYFRLYVVHSEACPKKVMNTYFFHFVHIVKQIHAHHVPDHHDTCALCFRTMQRYIIRDGQLPSDLPWSTLILIFAVDR